MAAAKTSMVFFIFALIAISANLQMASATGLECATGLSLDVNILTGCTVNSQCSAPCNTQCTLKYNRSATASVCVAGIVQGVIGSCGCCCASA